MTMSRKSLLRIGGWTVFVIAVLMTSQSPALAATDACISATLSDPILLPDGSEYPAGVLTLCQKGDYTPAASFHETYVNRRPIGLFLAQHCVSEGSAEDGPFMMFYRETDGRLRLYGYALPSRDRMTTYFLEQPAGGKAKDALRAAADATPAQCESPSSA